MCNKVIFLFLIQLFFIIKPASAQLILKGRVTNNTGFPLNGVNITDLNTKLGTATTATGTFILMLPKKYTVIRFTHIGYKTRDYIISDSLIKKSGKDTIEINMSLKPAETTLMEVEVVAKGIQRAYNKPWFTVLNYEFIENNILMLLESKNHCALRLVNDKDSTLLNKQLDFTPDDMLKDCLGNIQLLTPSIVYQVTVFDTALVLTGSPRLKYDQYLSPCALTFSNTVFFKEVKNHRQNVIYFYYTKEHVPKKFIEIYDKEGAKIADWHYWNYINYYMLYEEPDKNLITKGFWEDGKLIKLMLDAQHAGMLTFYENIVSREICVPLKQIGDTLYLFDHVNDYLMAYNGNKELIHKIPIKYHHQKNWDEKIIFNEELTHAYAVYTKDGIVFLKNINLLNGICTEEHKISEHIFPKKIKIKNGYVYYLWQGNSYSDKHNLFKQKLE